MTEHQPENQRFILEQDGYTCVLDYTLQGNRINFTHTYVPFRLRGKGLAEVMVRDALAWADEQGLTTTASCWYVAKILNA